MAAVGRLVAQRVHAFAGEFHSVIADAIVEVVQRSGLPSSARPPHWMTLQLAGSILYFVLRHLNLTAGLFTPTFWCRRDFGM